jgi:peptide/nickel transport system substrate-binding protein
MRERAVVGVRPLLGLGLAVMLVLSACSSSTSGSPGSGESATGTTPGQAVTGAPDREAPVPGPAKPGGSLVVGLSGETDSFNPYSGQWSQPSFVAANAMLEPLFAIDATGIAKPYLAESVQATGDFLTWTIDLRPGITFHDGTPLDAAAVKKSLDTGKKSGITSQVFTLVSSIEEAGPLSVRLTMTKPWATFPATLAGQPGYMAAPAMLDDPATANAKPIGTGPFVFEDRVRDASLETKKNPSYWRRDAEGRPLPYLDTMDFRVLADASSRSNALAAGDIDAMDVTTPDTYRQQVEAARRGEVQILTNVGSETDETVLALNTAREPFDEPLAREALKYGIDQRKLAATAYQDAFPGSWGMFEESSPYFISRADAGYPEPDPQKAKDLAAQYRAVKGKPLTFTAMVPPDPQYLAIAQTLQAQLKDLGIQVEVQAIEQTQLIRTVVATGEYQAAGFLLRGAPSPDQSYVFIATKAVPDGLSLNFTRFDDPGIVAGMDAFRAAGDPQSRVDAIAEVQERLASEVPMIFLVNARTAFVASNVVHGLRATTFPGTDKTAQAPSPTTPFFTFMWKG